MPVLGGFALEGGDPEGWSWRGSVFAGAAFGEARFEQAGRYVDPVLSIDRTWDGTGTLAGSAVAFELGGQVDYRIAADWSVFAEAAYLGARIRSMKWRHDVDLDRDGVTDYRKGNTLLSNKDRQPLAFDFSGARLRVGVTARFGGGAPAAGAE